MGLAVCGKTARTVGTSIANLSKTFARQLRKVSNTRSTSDNRRFEGKVDDQE